MTASQLLEKCQQANDGKPFIKRLVLSQQDYDSLPKADSTDPVSQVSGVEVITSVFLLPGFYAIEDTDGRMYLYSPTPRLP